MVDHPAEYIMRKTPAIALAIATVFGGIGAAHAAERLYPVVANNIAVYQMATVMRAFNGVFDDNDSSSYAVVDLREPMHITKMFFHGRSDNDVVSTRMRGAQFHVSNDAQNWTLVYQVPDDFTADENFAQIPCAFDPGETYRYVRWTNVGAGSMDEFQVWVDSTSVQVESFKLTDYSASTIAVSASGQTFGDAAGQTIAFKVAMAASDLGDDLADWVANGTVATLGTASDGIAVSGDIPVPAANQKYFVRLFATAAGITNASDSVKEITPYDYKTHERLFNVEAGNIIDTPSINAALLCFDGIFNNNDTVSYATIDLGEPFHITRLLFHGRPGLDDRLIGRSFKVSNDNENWTVAYTVPLEYAYDPNACNPTYWFPPPDETYRYVRWENIQWGSMDEVEIHVDSSSLSSVALAIDDYSSTNLTVTGLVRMYGPIAGSGCALSCAAASSDLGTDLDDWRSGGVVTALGTATSGVPVTAIANHLGAGMPAVVRLFATAGDLSKATPAKVVIPNDYTLFPVAAANVVDADTTQAQYMRAFDGILDQTNETGGDSASRLTLDLKALYPIARLKFYDRTGLADRMRGATFSASKDNVDWTLLYTVPNDYNGTQPAGAWIPWPSGDGVCTGDNLFRYVKWNGVQWGSISEFQVYAGPVSVVIVNDFSIDSATSSALQLSGSASLEGSFATSNVTFYAAYAASDLGEDLAAWQTNGTVAAVGAALAGETFTGSVALDGASGGKIYIRVFASVEGKTAASAVKTLMIRDCVEIRPLVENADSILGFYPTTYTGDQRSNAWLAFDNDASTLTTISYAALDLGRPVRIDRITMRVDPENLGNLGGLILQGSNDGFNWETLATFADVPQSEQALFDLAEPRAARYVRFFNLTSGTLLASRIRDLRFYTIASGQAHPAIANEVEASRSPAGIRLSATLAANGSFSGTARVRALCATSNLGASPADWTNAQGIVSIDLGDRAAGTSFSTTIPPAAAAGLNVARLLVETPAGAFLGAPHFFTPNNEILIPITVAQVEAMTPGVNSWYAENPAHCGPMAWHHTFFGDGNFLTTSDTRMPTAAALRKRYKITRAELYSRIEGAFWIMQRSNGATVYIAPEKEAADWTQESAWTTFATASTATPYDGWQQLVGTPTVGYHLKVDGGHYGNYFLRFWGVPMDVGTLFLLR
jgi:hypothetical protein